METWKKVWREGFAPLLPTAGLEALAEALRKDDCTLRQGCTTVPPPLMAVQDWPCEGGCLLSFVGWKGDGRSTVGEVEEFFAEACRRADERLGEPAACRWLINWWDDTARPEAFRDLLPEVELVLAERKAAAA